MGGTALVDRFDLRTVGSEGAERKELSSCCSESSCCGREASPLCHCIVDFDRVVRNKSSFPCYAGDVRESSLSSIGNRDPISFEFNSCGHGKKPFKKTLLSLPSLYQMLAY